MQYNAEVTKQVFTMFDNRLHGNMTLKEYKAGISSLPTSQQFNFETRSKFTNDCISLAMNFIIKVLRFLRV